MRRQRGVAGGGAMPSNGGGGGESGPRVVPMDMTSVKGILRDFDRAAYGEEFRADRLTRIAMLGKGGSVSLFARRERQVWIGLLEPSLPLPHTHMHTLFLLPLYLPRCEPDEEGPDTSVAPFAVAML